MGIIYLIYFVLVSIGLSKIDNKLGKTKYWYYYLSGVILLILFSFVGIFIGFFLKLSFTQIMGLALILTSIAWLLVLYGEYGILVKGACLDKKTFYVGVVVFIAMTLLDIYASYYLYFSGHFDVVMYSIGNFDKQALVLYKLESWSTIIKMTVIFYALYNLLVRVGRNKLYAIVFGFFLGGLYLPFLFLDPKINDLKPCDNLKE